MHYYSAKTGGLYSADINGENMPSDVITISSEEHAALMSAAFEGRMVIPGLDGRPMLSEPLEYSGDQLEAAERAWRDSTLLKACAIRDRHRDELELSRRTTLTPEQFSELLQYVQQLRDWPQSETFPTSDHRPVGPPWITEQPQ